MVISNPELWTRISDHALDDPAAVWPFSQRLAEENGWSQAYAERVVTEYKKFAYLACTLPEPVTPSDQVDQAWHLHLTYTKDYWERFCRQVLGRDLHHDPTQGGVEEDAKYRNWYLRTLRSYAEEFDVPPPADIWPPSDVRFVAPQFMRRIDTQSNWVVPRSAAGRLALGAVAIVLLGAGCFVGYRILSTGTPGEAFMTLFVAVWALSFIRSLSTGRGKTNGSVDSGCGGGGCGSGGCGSGGCGSGCGGGGCGGGCGS